MAAALAALGVRVAFTTPVGSDAPPYVTFILATAFSAGYGGLGPGLVTTLCGTLLAEYFIRPHDGSLPFVDPANVYRFLLICIVISYVCRVLIRTGERAKSAELSERRERRFSQQTMAAIGDGVISTDGLGRVQFLNPVAQRLTGFSVSDAKGQPLHTVFRVEADHVLARDGSRVPVEQHEEPIKDERGLTVGTVVVIHDVTTKKRNEAALQSQADELARSNRELEQFAYVASHDLQEPLRMVNVYTQLLLRDSQETLSAKSEEYAGFVQQGVEKMLRLIDDLLSFSRVVHADAERQPVDTGAALAHALSSCQQILQECGGEVKAKPLPRVIAQEGPLAMVFQNLISNAIKYRRPEVCPRVEIGVAQEAGQALFSVQDNGMGFDPAYAKTVFGLFKRLHGKEYPGTGLGLAICQRIVERYGGQIWVESKPGEGSTFYFRLPLA